MALGYLVALHSIETGFRSVILQRATSVQTMETPSASPGLGESGRPRRFVLPLGGMDTRWWVIHSDMAESQGALRTRWSVLDNAPVGREVYWSSGLPWLIRIIDRFLRHSSAGLSDGLAPAAAWAAPISLGLVLIGGVIAFARFIGFAWTAFVLLLLFSTNFIANNFRYGETDHHGLAVMMMAYSVASLALAIAFSGTDKKAREKSEALSIQAGFTGAVGLWISTSTCVIPIMLSGVAGILGSRLFYQKALRAPAAGRSVWTLWGITGSVVSLIFYLVEYFPNHLHLRLDVISPLHSLFWAALGYLGSSLLGGRRKSVVGFPSAWFIKHSVALLFLLLPLVVLVFFRGAAFAPADPFLSALHSEAIAEFRSVAASLAGSFTPGILLEAFGWPLLALALFGISLISRVMSPAWLCAAGIILVPAGVMQAFGLYQVRWHPVAMALWILLFAILFARFSLTNFRHRLFVLWGGSLAAVPFVLLFPLLDLGSTLSVAISKRGLPLEYSTTLLMRDLAHRIAQSEPDTHPIILADPTASTELAYYGRLPVLGTFYWENREGLVEFARLCAEPDPDRLRGRLARRGVTHIVSCSWDDSFTKIPQILRSTLPDELLAEGDGHRPGFLEKLIAGGVLPSWIEPLPYPVPAEFGLGPNPIKVFRIRP